MTDQVRCGDMKHYLSFGAGVNSTALMILLREQGIEFESVFADTGSEYPETYEHIAWLQGHGWPVTVIETTIKGLNLYDYCWQREIFPMRWLRWCTARFKIRPLGQYMTLPRVKYLGIDAGEAHRADTIKPEGPETVSVPLVEQGIDRDGCKRIIREADIPIPPKSGCYICPFQGRKQFRKLRDDHPTLYIRALALEQRTNARLAREGKPPQYMRDRPLDAVVEEGQLDMFGWRAHIEATTLACPVCEVMRG